jgi:hypothetical protein
MGEWRGQSRRFGLTPPGSHPETLPPCLLLSFLLFLAFLPVGLDLCLGLFAFTLALVCSFVFLFAQSFMFAAATVCFGLVVPEPCLEVRC